jgi:hypothetical protein
LNNLYRWWIICIHFRAGRIRSDLRSLSDLFGLEYNLIWFFKKIKLIRSDPNPTWDQITFNPIKIYQKSEKTQYINWSDPDPIWPDLISSRRLNWSDPNPNPTRPARLPPLVLLEHQRIQVQWRHEWTTEEPERGSQLVAS